MNAHQRAAALRAVKVVHTVVWALFAGCILAIPAFAWQRRFQIVVVLGAAIFLEIGILLLNGWRCPLTNVAARYTDQRQDNFDIFLPLWLARHNETIFGWIFAADLLLTLACWREWL
jgi:hypothetical protein